jgi:hypothetical protein
VPGLPGGTPDGPGRHLDQRDQRADALGERGRGVAGPVRREQPAKLAERPGRGVHECPARRGQGAGVQAGELLAEDRGQRPVQRRLDQRAERQAVAGGDEMDRRAHQGDPDHLPAHQQLGKVTGLEPGQPAPKPVVRRERRLRLQAGQVLDHRHHGCGPARAGGQRGRPEQHLPREQGPVQGPQVQHVGGHQRFPVVSE